MMQTNYGQVKPKNKLQLKAENMRERALAHPGKLIRDRLGQGALLGLTFDGENAWELRVARYGVMPGDGEMKTFARDFDCPPNYVIGPDGDKKLSDLGWKGYLLTWIDEPPGD